MEHSEGYYSGTVEVDGECCAFYAKDDTFGDECGEVELAAYSEPGYLTGASFEKLLPDAISAQYAAIADKVNETIDQYEHEAEIADATYYDDYPSKRMGLRGGTLRITSEKSVTISSAQSLFFV